MKMIYPVIFIWRAFASLTDVHTKNSETGYNKIAKENSLQNNKIDGILNY